MKRFRNLIAAVLILVMVGAPLTALEVRAAETDSDYMTMAEAAEILREKLEQRAMYNIVLKFTLEDPRQYTVNQIFDMLVDMATQHTGNPTQGDYLRNNYLEWNYDMQDDFDGTTHKITFTFDVLIPLSTAEEEVILTQKIEEVMSSLNLSGKSDYEKIKAIYDYICSHVRYDHETNDQYGMIGPDASIPAVRQAFCAYGAMMNGKAVCQGYATLLYRMLLQAGIDSRMIDGGQAHVWNIAKLGDTYYLLDATWENDTGEKIFFLRGVAEFCSGPGHEPEPKFATKEFTDRYPIAILDYGAAEPDPNALLGSGSCGKNATWTLTGDGTLTISGRGSIYAYGVHGNEDFPWLGLNGYVKKVIIGDGITEIGEKMFRNHPRLTSVSIPDSVTSIGKSAFEHCTALEQITLPNSVTAVGESAFFLCYGLKQVTLSNRLTVIASKMFANCIALEGISIPSSVTTIEDLAFFGAFDPNAKVAVTVPATVHLVGISAFEASNIYSVDWKASVKKMESAMFSMCVFLEEATLSDTLEEFGSEYGVFQNCTSLKQVTLPSGLKEPGYGAFALCVSLETITLPDSLRAIGYNMFCNSGLKEIELPATLKEIDINGFNKCTRLEHITIPASVERLGIGAFADCSGLKWVSFEGDVPETEESLFAFTECIAYYPSGNTTWSEDAIEKVGSGGILTWVKKHPANASHTPENDWSYDDASHWKQCTGCEQVLDGGSHAYGDSDGYCDATCAVCGYIRGSHDWENGVCTVCGANKSKPTEPTTPDAGESTQPGEKKDFPVLFVLGGTVALLGGAAAVVLLVVKKRKKA